MPPSAPEPRPLPGPSRAFPSSRRERPPVPRSPGQMVPGTRLTTLPDIDPSIQRFIRPTWSTGLSCFTPTAAIAVKIGRLRKGRYGPDGIRHFRDEAPGCRQATRARVAQEFLRGSQGPPPLLDAQGDRAGVRTRRCARPRRAASLLPDTRALPFHPVLRRDPRRLLEL